jgi:hypothetical protein
VTEEEFETLRSWGDSLTEDARPEVRAAGRAILLLASEVERLQVELWHAQLHVAPAPAAEEAPEPVLAELPADAEPEVAEGAPPVEIEPQLQHQLRSALSRAGRLTRRFQPERARRGDL